MEGRLLHNKKQSVAKFDTSLVRARLPRNR
jgi:hypothetical protein